MNHVANKHEWAHNELYHQCSHRQYSAEEVARKKWITLGLPTHNHLLDIVFDKGFCMDLSKLTVFCQAGCLEVFNSKRLKYCPKRQHFSHKGMVCRAELAALDQNANTVPQQKLDSDGKPVFGCCFLKRSKKWVARASYETCDQTSLKWPIMETILEMNKEGTGVLEEQCVVNIKFQNRYTV